MKKKHLTKSELLYHYSGLSRMKRFGVGVAYRDSAIMVNYLLYKEECFRESKLVGFNQLVLNKYKENKSIEDINRKLHIKAGFTLEPTEIKEKDIQKTGNALIDRQRIALINEDIMMQRETEKYVIYSYDALCDMGYGKKRLNRVRQYMHRYADAVTSEKIEEMQKELFDKVGLVIELPEGF